MYEDYVCGFSFWHPKWLQRFASTRWFLAVYGLLGTVQGISSAYLVVTLTTLEKRFHMPSQTTGIVLSGNEVSQILLSLVLSYIGGQKNRPLWIAWGLLFCGLSCLVLALPHFIYGIGDETYHLTKEYFEEIGEDWSSLLSNSTTRTSTKKGNSLCLLTGVDGEKCNDLVTILPLVLIFLSQFILGVGNTLYYSLGQTYLDDNTNKGNTPLLFAYAMAMRMIGPTLGFVLGPQALNIFIDPSKTPLINKDDPRWLGAWWLGWIIIGFIMFIFSGLLALFPRKLPRDGQNILENSLTDTPQTTEQYNLNSPDIVKYKEQISVNERQNKISFEDFYGALKRVARNKIIIFNNISGIFYILGASGYFIYLGRYVEVQFHKPSRNATALAGQLTMFGTVLGLLLSGWIMSKRRIAPSKVLFWNVIIGCCYVLGEFSYMFLYCKGDTAISQWSNLTTSCNQNCYCGSVSYNPVCYQNTSKLFFSPCHAGCKSWDPRQNVRQPKTCSWTNNERLRIVYGFETYSNCTCAIEESFTNFDNHGSAQTHDLPTLTGGLCSKESCMFDLYAFSILAMLIAWLNSTGKIGNILVNYRAVADEDKAFTQGLTLMMISLFAFTPGPIIFGRVMDNACIVWKYKCGKRGDCQLYDQDAFRYYMNGLAIVFTTFGTIFDVLVWYYGRHLDLYGDKQQKGEEETNKDPKGEVTNLLNNVNRTDE